MALRIFWMCRGVSAVDREINGLKGTVARARSAGYDLSEYTLRRAVRSGAIPCRVVGRTYLLAWSNVLRWLMCEDSSDNAPVSDCGGIRRVEVG